MRREKEFRQQCCRNSTKMRREKKKKVERESRGISATLLPKFLCPKMVPGQLKKSNCGNVIAEKGKKKKKIWFGNCGNAIADNVKKKKFILANCGNPIADNAKKKLWNTWMSKKKVVTFTIFSQYFHNKSHVINYY